jgi:CubicO group peptidase (beta-lactamase class C family)
MRSDQLGTKEQFRALLNGHVSRNAVSGLLSIVSKDGVSDVIAATAPGGEQIATNSIVRISSLTKPIVAAATMALAERGRLDLDDPIERFIPELAARRVLLRVDGPLDETEPARHAITIRHLLTCTMGFGFPMTKGPHPVLAEAARLQLGFGPPKPATPHEPNEWIRRFASLPLMAHPGETWLYDASFGVLGVLISRAFGNTLHAALVEYVLGPLDMEDTDFWVPSHKTGRFIPCYEANNNGEVSTVFDHASDGQWTQPPNFPNAAGGLVSTADDYLKFAQMLLANGVYRECRILDPRSIEMMTTNYVSEHQRGPGSAIFLEARGWGFGMSVARPPDDDWSRAGRYGWDGGLGTSWFNDPNAGVVALLVTQRFPPPFGLFTDFWKGVTATWCA